MRVGTMQREIFRQVSRIGVRKALDILKVDGNNKWEKRSWFSILCHLLVLLPTWWVVRFIILHISESTPWRIDHASWDQFSIAGRSQAQMDRSGSDPSTRTK